MTKKKSIEELKRLHISTLRKMVNEDPDVSPVAKANRWHLTKLQLILNLRPLKRAVRKKK